MNIGKGLDKKKRIQLISVLRQKFKKKGLPMEKAIDYAIRLGLRRHPAVSVAREAYRVAPPNRKVKVVPGGRVSPR